MICEICHKTYNNYKGLSAHIRQAHNIKSDEYYLQYINPNNLCVCGKPTQFKSLQLGFYKYCSIQCSNSDISKIKQQNITFMANQENSEHARLRRINYNQSEIGRKNSSKVGKKTGSKNLTKAHKKLDKTYWCDVCQKETKHILSIGCLSCYNKSEDHKQSIAKSVQNKYGEQYTCVWQVPEIKQKIVDTSLKKYGITNAGNCRDARIKANYTMRQNGNYSSEEDYFANELKKLGINYISQYSSNVYPYLCDFYLPNSDTYIELNLYWSHGKHYFDETNENDVKILQKWKDKAKTGHKQYKNAINVWTKSDLEKLNKAKANNLNYVVLWTHEEIINYVQKLCSHQLIEIKE